MNPPIAIINTIKSAASTNPLGNAMKKSLNFAPTTVTVSPLATMLTKSPYFSGFKPLIKLSLIGCPFKNTEIKQSTAKMINKIVNAVKERFLAFTDILSPLLII